jgi:hypothetical protein
LCALDLGFFSAVLFLFLKQISTTTTKTIEKTYNKKNKEEAKDARPK